MSDMMTKSPKERAEKQKQADAEFKRKYMTPIKRDYTKTFKASKEEKESFAALNETKLVKKIKRALGKLERLK